MNKLLGGRHIEKLSVVRVSQLALNGDLPYKFDTSLEGKKGLVLLDL